METTTKSNWYEVGNWSNSKRYDLRMIPEMVKAGWTPILSDQDKLYKRDTFEFVPHDAVSFVKEKKQVWQIIDRRREKMVWQTADLIDGYYRNHKPVDTLEEIINQTNNEPMK